MSSWQLSAQSNSPQRVERASGGIPQLPRTSKRKRRLVEKPGETLRRKVL